jgi:haloalkane dehalogenase
MVKERIINNIPLSTKKFAHLYPFASRFLTLPCAAGSGHQMHYVDQGTGPVVVMVHGNPTWSFYFRHLICHLSGQFRTIAPDHIGCGFSDKPSPRDYDYTLTSRVRDLDRLIAHCCPDEKISLILHDWGGMIGLAWALAHLDRIHRIVITNTAGFFLPPTKSLPLALKVIQKFPWAGVSLVQGLNAFSRGALYLAARKPLDPAVKKGLTAPYNSFQNRIATLKFVQDIPMAPTDPAHDMVACVDQNLSRLADHQVLLLWGLKDFVFDRSFLNEFQQRFPRAACRTFAGAGHYLFEDEPEACLKWIHPFLSGNYQPFF